MCDEKRRRRRDRELGREQKDIVVGSKQIEPLDCVGTLEGGGSYGSYQTIPDGYWTGKDKPFTFGCSIGRQESRSLSVLSKQW